MVFRCSKLIRKLMKNGNLMKILCSKWLSDVSDSSSNTVFSSLEMLRQAFMPVSFSCFLFIDLSAFNFNCFNFNFINWKACYIEWKLTWPLKTIPFLCLDKLLDCFPSILWIVIHLHCGALSDQFCTMIALAPIHAHAVTLLTPYWKNLCGMLLMRCPFPSQNICVFSPWELGKQSFFFKYILRQNQQSF